MRWTFDNAPPRNLETWCLVDGGDEPYLVRGAEVGDPWKAQFSITATTEPDTSVQYIPPHHTIIAWRRA